jgi:hypothetical protein
MRTLSGPMSEEEGRSQIPLPAEAAASRLHPSGAETSATPDLVLAKPLEEINALNRHTYENLNNAVYEAGLSHAVRLRRSHLAPASHPRGARRAAGEPALSVRLGSSRN